MDIELLAKQIIESKLQIQKNQNELEGLSLKFIRLLGSDKSFETHSFIITTRDDIEFA
jgi:hypothetical protein